MSLLQTRLRWQRLARADRDVALRVAVLASFTANPLTPYLGVALADAGLPADVWIGPYNQIAQECLSDTSETATYEPDVLLCWPRLEELWGGQPLPLADDPARYTADALDLAEVSLDAARRWRALLVFVLPAIPELRPLGAGDASLTNGVWASATAAREALHARLSGQRNVLLLDLEEVVRTLGSGAAYNYRLLALARIPFSEELFSAVGARAARLIRLSRRPARRVVIVDADNTLWGGVVGEDGPDGVDLRDGGPGESFRSFQRFLLDLRRAGMLLALCSKNDERDVWAVFERREMLLQRAHFAATRIGWQPKAEALREIVAELGVGIDSVVLIDDNPVEIAAVEAELPDVACLTMPADPAEWPTVIAAADLWDRLPPTAEDLRRADQYAEEHQRQQAARRVTSKAEYLSQLELALRISAPGSSDLARLSQLVSKTNQFNLNCRRRSEPELAALLDDPSYLLRVAAATDRYGDYGLVGVAIVRLLPDAAELDTFLLSCRALGRGIEEAMLADLCDTLAARGLRMLTATIIEQPRNEPARRFFAQLGGEIGATRPLEHVGWPSYIERRAEPGR